MILVNTESIPGKEFEAITIVKGSTVRAKDLGRTFLSKLEALAGGELPEIVNLLEESRHIATKKMIEEAKKLGADAVVNVRYMTSEIMQDVAEIMVYGTAVKFK